MSRSEPTYFVIVEEEGGEKRKLDLTDLVMSLEYHDEEDKADKLVLKIRNWDLSAFDDPVWKPGNKLCVSWGYVGEMSRPRTCTIMKMTGSTELSIEAQGEESKMNRVVKCRSFTGMTRAAVAKQIAEEHGWDTSLIDVEDTAETIEVQTQARLSDHQFLRRLAELEGFQFFADVDEFHFHQRRMAQQPSRVFRWYVPPRASTATTGILKWNVSNDIWKKPNAGAGSVAVHGRDPKTKETFVATGSESTTKRDKVAPVEVIIDPRSGAVTAQTPPAKVTMKTGGTTTTSTRPTTAKNKGQAKRQADAAFRLSQNATVELDMSIVGEPHLEAKGIIEVQRISKLLSGLYYIKTIRHKLGSSGYTADLKLTSDGVNAKRGSISGKAPTSAAISKAKVNTKKGKDGDPGALTPVVTIDGKTGEKTVTYVAKGGKK